MRLKLDQSDPSFVEFVLTLSLMMSVIALPIDAMLPALPQIGQDLGVANPNDRQLIISILLLGSALGQLFFGPLSDRTGRKPVVLSGYAIFIGGCLLSVFAGSFPMMLGSRFLQGVGISAPQSMTMAIVRDRYAGRPMARVMSFVMTVFILIPMVAPMMGQAILNFSSWRGIFVSFVLFALVTLLWFSLRIPETLAPASRAPFTVRRIMEAGQVILKNRTAFGFTLATGLVGGAFLGYLNSSQQIFQELYGLGEHFPLYFAVIAFSIGLASLLNARLVMRFGMRFLVRWALRISLLLSVVALGVAALTSGQPPLWFLMAYLLSVFFCQGLLFGNLSSMAMEPLGYLAGIGAAVVGSLTALTETPLGALIGQAYNKTIVPMLLGIAILSGLAILLVRWADSSKCPGDQSHEQEQPG